MGNYTNFKNKILQSVFKGYVLLKNIFSNLKKNIILSVL